MAQKDLFDAKHDKMRAQFAPLADRMRPQSLDEFMGQEPIVGPTSMLRRLFKMDKIPSMVFWGPPGTGKTTLAHIIANETKSRYVELSATTSGLKEVREVVKEAEEQQKFFNKRTILFVDEIHRFNKAQQDAFLPHVERGTITLIGATTENPSFEVNSALLSRCRVFVLAKLESKHLEEIIRRALKDNTRGLGSLKVKMDDKAVALLAGLADGDARVALNALELAVEALGRSPHEQRPTGEAGTPGTPSSHPPRAGGGTRSAMGKDAPNVVELTAAGIKEALQKSHLLYDRAGEEHYNIISALHKSMRGSDADAALYWLGRMLEAGEDPLYVARRLVRFASEDVGLADPQALLQAVAAYQAAHLIGMPECNVVLAQAVVYLSRAKKSNALYVAYGQVQRAVSENPTEPVPLHLRNAPTELMKDLGFGKGYKYNPAFKTPVEQDYLPASMRGKKFLE